MFQGFSEETTQFLWGVRLNNYRDWFLPHKEEYINYVYEPLKALAVQVQEEVNGQFPRAQLNCNVTRIYRDARRLHNRGPYKDHLWFTLRASEGHGAAFYFEISPEGYETGMGYYCPRPSEMERFRRRVLREPEELEKLARRLGRSRRFQLEGEEYKRPKGEVSDLLKPWFNRKSIALCSFREPDELFYSPKLAHQVAEDFAWLMPFYQYFQALDQEPLLG